MRVSDVMSRNVVIIGESDSCLEAVRRMHAARVRHLPVVSGGGALTGVVTDRDLRHHLFSPSVFPEVGSTAVDILLGAVPVSEIMSSPVTSVTSTAELGEAARVMREYRVGSLPVVEPSGRVVGIVTETDLLRQICRFDEACAKEVTEIVVSYP